MQLDTEMIYQDALQLLILLGERDQTSIAHQLNDVSEDDVLDWLIHAHVGSYNIFTDDKLLKRLISELKSKFNKENN